MASDQLSRKDNTKDETVIRVEKVRVPKMASHFESLAAEKGKATEDISHDRHHQDDFVSLSDMDKQRHANTVADKEAEAKRRMEKSEPQTVGKFEVEARGKEKGSSDKSSNAGDKNREKSNVMGKEENRGESTDEGNKEQYSFGEISKLRAEAQQKSNDAIRAAEDKYKKALQVAREEIGQKGAQAKDTCLEHAHYLVDRGQAAKETAINKAQQGGAAAKDTIVGAKDYTVQKAAEAKEAAVSTGGKAKDYTLQKAVEAKDVTVDTSKDAAQYAGKTAVSVKDKAAAAGWTAAHYSTEKAVDGTKAAARVVKGAAEYAGHKAAEIAAVPLTAAKDMALSAGETAKGYTARKKEEAQRGLDTKQMSTEGQETFQGEGKKKEDSREYHEIETSDVRKNRESGQDMTKEVGSHGVEELGNERGTKGTSMLGAIGETIVEIAQTTKELVIGEDVSPHQKRDQRSKSS
uniref:Seed biotin-containing protein SBP65 n=3 Tax=Cannabis sativa TaxID=3483 RepID=A0A803QJB5_CANSA